MPLGSAVAITMFAQASAAQTDTAAAQPASSAQHTYGPPAPPKPAPKKPVASDQCQTPEPNSSTREIIVCAQRPNGYRLNPDIMEAKRELRSGGRPTQHHKLDQKECAIGPFGCNYGAGINVIAAATTLATMAKRLSDGKEIGSMFLTTPTPSEYELYLAAKKRREANEKAAADAGRAKAAQAAADAGQKPAVVGDTPAAPPPSSP